MKLTNDFHLQNTVSEYGSVGVVGAYAMEPWVGLAAAVVLLVRELLRVRRRRRKRARAAAERPKSSA